MLYSLYIWEPWVGDRSEDGEWCLHQNIPPQDFIPPQRSQKWDGAALLYLTWSRAPEPRSVRVPLAVSAVASARGVVGVFNKLYERNLDLVSPAAGQIVLPIDPSLTVM
jgi:hypothetical protein